MTLNSSFIPLTQFNGFLIDASGVIYNDSGVFEGVVETIETLQSIAPVFLVTNNSFQSIPDIKEKMKNTGIYFEENRIISSGLGVSMHPDFRRMVEGKQVGVFGSPSSEYYVRLANPKDIVSDWSQADVLVMTSTRKHNFEAEYNRLQHVVAAHPNIPIICCNPDQHVVRWLPKDSSNSSEKEQTALYPVIGYYAQKLEDDYGVAIQWMGKPEACFSQVVEHILKKEYPNADPEKKWLFLDDNIHNVVNLEKVDSISGCLVEETGLYLYHQHQYNGSFPQYRLKKLSTLTHYK